MPIIDVRECRGFQAFEFHARTERAIPSSGFSSRFGRLKVNHPPSRIPRHTAAREHGAPTVVTIGAAVGNCRQGGEGMRKSIFLTLMFSCCVVHGNTDAQARPEANGH